MVFDIFFQEIFVSSTDFRPPIKIFWFKNQNFFVRRTRFSGRRSIFFVRRTRFSFVVQGSGCRTLQGRGFWGTSTLRDPREDQVIPLAGAPPGDQQARFVLLASLTCPKGASSDGKAFRAPVRGYVLRIEEAQVLPEYSLAQRYRHTTFSATGC